jgi:hypothetical protein
MKRLWVLSAITVTATLLLGGCAPADSSSNTGSSTPSATASHSSAKPTAPSSAKPTASNQPLENPSSDPAAGSGAQNSDGKGDPLARTTVSWADYQAGTQADIDAQTAAGDCKSLDSQYGGAIANEESVRASSGHGAEALLAYIDEARALAACS